MKKVLTYSGLIACVLALVSFVLLMATPAVSYNIIGGKTLEISGIYGIFGGTKNDLLKTTYNLPWAGLLAWIFALVAMVALVLTAVLPLCKVDLVKDHAKTVNLVAAAVLVLSGVFTFLEVVAFEGANADKGFDKGNLGVGWIISGILLIVAGVFVLLPTIMALVEKKK